jgi:signal transduction histidine kinase
MPARPAALPNLQPLSPSDRCPLHADVTACSDGTWLVVEVRDDGIGGAPARGGSGLTGLADRVAALGGRLTITSPAGGGATIRADLPCA